MKINSINGLKTKYEKQKHNSFKKGLTSYEINKVNRMGRYEYENIVSSIRSRYGIDADVGGSNTVAFCLDSVCEIMNRAGFKLPKRFKFEPLPNGILGRYNYADTVTINSDYGAFRDLESQNRLEESQHSFHPDTRNFLQTYLHEFSHAAHYHNIESKHGSYAADNIFWSELNECKPNDLIVDPVHTYMKTLFPSILDKLISDIFPPEIGWYSMKNLLEYFAEKNSHSLAEQLGENFIISNVKKDFASDYTGFPEDWDINEQINKLKAYKLAKNMSYFSNILALGSSVPIRFYLNAKIAKLFIDDIEFLDGEIWNGNIENLKSKSVAMKNLGYD